MEEDEIVIIGIGNPIMGDDGVGVKVARSLRKKLPRIEVIEGSVYCPDLLPFLEGRRKAIIIDGIDADSEPGSVFRFSAEDVRIRSNAIPVSLHDFGVSELLTAAKLIDSCPEEVIVYGIQVKDVDIGEHLSDEVRAAVDKVCSLIVDEVKKDVQKLENKS